MIFVTVGTTHFDSLIKTIDELVNKQVIKDKVVCQIGSGKYEPSYCEWYRSKPSINDDIKAADLIITHGGFTVLECIFLAKSMIAVANTELTGNHQAKFLDALSQEVTLNWIQDLNRLPSALENSKSGGELDWDPHDLSINLNIFLHGLSQ